MQLQRHRSSFHRGFSLVEVIVVVGIIAILVSVLAVSLGGASESANATKCLGNLRSLAMAANSAGLQGDYYPAAGSFAYRDIPLVKERKGWISWLSENEMYPAKTFQKADTLPMYGFGNEEQNLFCITNGALWFALGQNREVYCCPTLERIRKDHSARTLFTYAMNSKFCYDRTKGSKALAGWMGVRYGKLDHAEKILLFAEIPYLTEKGESPDSNAYTCDCTLTYKASVNGTEYGKSWSGTGEEIGFNHPVGKRIGKGNPCHGAGGAAAHVVFADGHTAKYMQPGSNGGLTAAQITALLCEGKEIAYDGKSYSEMQ